MGTKRTPVDRRTRMEITPEAVRLFEAMKRIECTCAPRDWERYWEFEPCEGCEERSRLRRAIHRELKLPPWAIPCVVDPNAPNPWPAGSPRHARWRPNPDAVARWRALEAASREMRR